MSEKYNKALISPKVRLLLSIYLQGFPHRSSWRKKLEIDLDCNKGNLTTHINSLLDDKLIVSLNPNNFNPPYKVTAKGKKYLKPIIYPYQLGLFIMVWTAGVSLVYYLLFSNQLLLFALVFLIFILFSFIIVALLLVLHPYILLKRGKVHY
jgi:hypothetical protein